MNAHETYQVMVSMETHARDLTALARRRSVERRTGGSLVRRARKAARG